MEVSKEIVKLLADIVFDETTICPPCHDNNNSQYKSPCPILNEDTDMSLGCKACWMTYIATEN